MSSFHRDSYYGYRTPRYVPRYKAIRFYKADLWGTFFHSTGGRWKFKYKGFRGKRMWLFLFSGRIAGRYMRRLNPQVLRKYRRRLFAHHLVWYTKFRLRKFYPALCEGAIRRAVRVVAAKTRYVYDSFFLCLIFFFFGRAFG